ncbi:Cys-tRNA(Pro) deacylase [Peptoniphilaceae bacterium SGI.131]
MNKEKTNAIRILEQKKLDFITRDYNQYIDQGISGMDVAKYLGQDENRVFKTLVTIGKSGQNYVFMIPVNRELNLKKAAKAIGEKNIAMIKSKDLLALTGYVHGGCSPIGMKKAFVTTINETAEAFDTIIFSGGKIGFQVEMAVEELRKVIKFNLEDIVD